MPILDDIRRNQIAEAMNYDRTMYMKAFQLTKRAVNVMDPEPAPENEPYVQVNPEETGAVGELVSEMMQLLEQKYNDLDDLLRGGKDSNVDEVGKVEDLLTSYNKLVSALIRPNLNPQTSSALRTEVMKIERYTEDLEAMCEQALDAFVSSGDASDPHLLLHEGPEGLQRLRPDQQAAAVAAVQHHRSAGPGPQPGTHPFQEGAVEASH
jgi:hypothetical protein